MAPEWDLLVLQGPSLGARVVLDPTGTTIGRAAGCNLPIQGEGLSREHAWVRKEEEVWFVYDLKSTNGIYVNGERVCKAALGPGDVIGLGRSVVLKLVEARSDAPEGEPQGPPTGGEPGSSAPAEAFIPPNNGRTRVAVSSQVTATRLFGLLVVGTTVVLLANCAGREADERESRIVRAISSCQARATDDSLANSPFVVVRPKPGSTRVLLEVSGASEDDVSCLRSQAPEFERALFHGTTPSPTYLLHPTPLP